MCKESIWVIMDCNGGGLDDMRTKEAGGCREGERCRRRKSASDAKGTDEDVRKKALKQAKPKVHYQLAGRC